MRSSRLPAPGAPRGRRCSPVYPTRLRLRYPGDHRHGDELLVWADGSLGSPSLDCLVNLPGDIGSFIRLQNAALSLASCRNVPVHLVVSCHQCDLTPRAHPLHDRRCLTRHTSAKLISETVLRCDFQRRLQDARYLTPSERRRKQKQDGILHRRPFCGRRPTKNRAACHTALECGSEQPSDFVPSKNDGRGAACDHRKKKDSCDGVFHGELRSSRPPVKLVIECGRSLIVRSFSRAGRGERSFTRAGAKDRHARGCAVAPASQSAARVLCACLSTLPWNVAGACARENPHPLMDRIGRPHRRGSQDAPQNEPGLATCDALAAQGCGGCAFGSRPSGDHP
jgi:hypothetical protein